MRVLIAGLAFLMAPLASAQPAVRYTVAPAPTDAAGVSRSVRVTLTLPEDAPAGPVTLIMPRAIPMGYGQQPYDQFVIVTAARAPSGAAATVRRGEGPRWMIASADARDRVEVIDYEVDLMAMESAILAGGDSSHARDGFISLLGYSVFAYVEGLEDRGVELSISAPPDRPAWPVFSTLAPKAPAAAGPLPVSARDFYNLADSQILMGPGFDLSRVGTAPELFLAIHAEGPVDPKVMAPLARQAFDALIGYFGTTPFPHFTLLFDYLKPLSPRHTYGFSMEHMESATFGALATAAPTTKSTERERAAFRYNVAHHISHAWIPKRCAGEGYFPFRWELAPLIDTIWLSEGFGQYAAADALSDVLPPSSDGRAYRDVLVEARFRNTLREMPETSLAFGHFAVPLMAALFPTFRFLCCYRHPRATLVSEFIDFRFRRKGVKWILPEAIADDRDAFVTYLRRQGEAHLNIVSQMIAVTMLQADPIARRLDFHRPHMVSFDAMLDGLDEAEGIADFLGVDLARVPAALEDTRNAETKTKATELQIDRKALWSDEAEEVCRVLGVDAFVQRGRDLGWKI